MKFRNKLIKGIAFSMVFTTLFTSTAFATPIDLRDSVLDVQYDSLNQDTGTTYYDDEIFNEWDNGTINEEVRVKVNLGSEFIITIPKDIVLDGEAKKADYQVNVKGDIAGDQKITVVPDTDFQMDEAGGKTAITATVTQPDTDFTYDQIKDAGKTVDGVVEAPDMTAGDWSGSFFFNINYINKTNLYRMEYTSPNGYHDIEEFPSVIELKKFIDTHPDELEEVILELNADDSTEPQDLSELFINANKLKVLDLRHISDTMILILDNLLNKNNNIEILYITQEIYNKIPDLAQKININEEKIIIVSDINQRNELNDYSWREISSISKSGKAEEYFSLGDVKTVEINGVTHVLEIIGFNHDDLADGSGEAGITFASKELVLSGGMNSTKTNTGGWEASKMRTYVNQDLYNSLPNDLQKVIKIVNKKTSAGNTSNEIITSQDKIFLLSTIEVLGETGYSKAGEGEQYAYYVNGGSKIKQHANDTKPDKWWTRSPNGGAKFSFATIDSSGNSSSNEATDGNSYIFAFCI